jgi:hypothetical protein
MQLQETVEVTSRVELESWIMGSDAINLDARRLVRRHHSRDLEGN